MVRPPYGLRLRCWPRLSGAGLLTLLSLTGLSAAAGLAGAVPAAAVLGALAVSGAVRSLLECSAATAAVASAFEVREVRWRSSIVRDLVALDSARAPAEEPATLTPAGERAP